MNKYNELNAINEMFVPERLHMFVNIDELSQYSDIDFEIKRELVRIHEKIHYLQTGMTSYGQSRWNIYRQSISCILSDWIKATNKYKNKRPIPIGYLRTKSKEDLINSFQIKLIGQDTLTFFSLQVYVEDVYKKADDLSLYYLKGDYELTPKIRVNSQTYSINGIDILECHAKMLEALYALKLHNIPINNTLNKEKLPKRYYYIWEWFSGIFGKDAILDFLTICDLSLQTGEWKIPNGKENWYDQHPGWRFYNLTNTLKENKIEMFVSEIDLIQRYDSYCSMLLKKCGYELLEDVFKRCLLRYEFRCDNCESLGLEKRMLEILKFRMKYRWVGACPFADLSIWSEINKQFNPVLMQEGDDLRVVPFGQDKVFDENNSATGILLESDVELHLQALANQILGNISPYSLDIEEIQCGYKYFGFHKGCCYQANGQCTGSFNPKKGTEVSWEMTNGIIKGCRFEALMYINGIGASENIDLNFGYKHFPSLKEITKILENIE